VTTGVLGIPADAAAAATPAGTPAPDAFGLSVSPARLSIAATPGSHTQTFVVSDSGADPRHIVINTGTFHADSSGSIVVTGVADTSADWVTVAPRVFDLAPGGSQTVIVTLAVPAEPEPGERQLSLLVSTPTTSRGGNLTVNASVGVELFVQVPGPVQQRFGIGPLDLPRVADGGPIAVAVTVTDAGTVHRDYITPHNLVVMHGSDVAAALPSVTVLKGSSRTIGGVWLDPPRLCLCTVQVTTDDGQGHQIAAQSTVLVFPFRVAGGVLLCAAGILVLAGRLRRRGPAPAEPPA
jgi:hypothetical protein